MKASIQNPGIYPFDINTNRVNCTINIKVSGGVIPKSHFNYTLGQKDFISIAVQIFPCLIINFTVSKVLYMFLSCFFPALLSSSVYIAVKKLLKLRIDGSLVAFVQDFLSNREQCVKFRNTKSIFSSINIGVPQGTVLGPLLWNAFIDDLSPPTPHLKYADDTTLYHSLSKPNCVLTNSTAHRASVGINDNHLQRALDYTSQYCTDNCLLLNVNKTFSTNFTLQKTLTIDT